MSLFLLDDILIDQIHSNRNFSSTPKGKIYGEKALFIGKTLRKSHNQETQFEIDALLSSYSEQIKCVLHRLKLFEFMFTFVFFKSAFSHSAFAPHTWIVPLCHIVFMEEVCKCCCQCGCFLNVIKHINS